MDRRNVASSSIKSVGYDVATAVLEVEFHKYGTFRYYKVPEFLYQGLMIASSKGAFFNSRIREHFESEEMDRP